MGSTSPGNNFDQGPRRSGGLRRNTYSDGKRSHPVSGLKWDGGESGILRWRSSYPTDVVSPMTSSKPCGCARSMPGNWGTPSALSPPSWEFVRRPSPAGVPDLITGAEGLYPVIAPGGRSAPVASSPGNRSKASSRRSRPRPRRSWRSPSALWTRRAVRDFIHQQFGIRLPIRTVGEYLRRWGYTPQKPVRKAYKQDPKAVAQWLEQTYPAIERRAAKEGGEIHWGDETGVRSTCQHGRGDARPGATPELIVPGSRFSVNMIATITNQGTVRWMIYPGTMNAALFLVFLTRLIAGATKKVFLIVDHLSVHEAAVVDQWLSDKTDRIEVFSLPKYAPERNPDEYLNCD